MRGTLQRGGVLSSMVLPAGRGGLGGWFDGGRRRRRTHLESGAGSLEVGLSRLPQLKRKKEYYCATDIL